MAEQRVWRINLARAKGTNTQEPGAVEIAAPTKEAAVVILAEHLMALLTAPGVMGDITWDYNRAAALGDRWEPDAGEYTAPQGEIDFHRRCCETREKPLLQQWRGSGNTHYGSAVPIVPPGGSGAQGVGE